MKSAFTIKRETVFKLSTGYLTLFLAMISFFLMFNSRKEETSLSGLLILFLILIIFFVVNLIVSLRSLKETESLFKEKEQFFERISNMSCQGIFLVDPRGIIVDLNIKAQSYFYEDKINIIGKSIFRNLDCNLNSCSKFRAIFYNDMGPHFNGEIYIKSIDFQNNQHYIIFVEDQTERINEENHLKKLANEDPLTGLLNRRSFFHELNKEVERSSRIGLTCTLVMLDLDHFKKINDTYGHDFGDEVLTVFAQILRENGRQLDIFCRFGGEEFVLLMPHTNLVNSMNFLMRIKQEFADHSYTHNIKPTFSGGALSTEIRGDKNDINQLLKEIDQLLYKAKENGRNRIETKGQSIKLIKVS